MKKVFVALTIGLIMLKASLSTAFGHGDSLELGDDRRLEEEDNAVGGSRCCHSDSLQGTIQSYPLNSATPASYRFFYDRNGRRLALAYESDRREIVRCSEDRVCVVSAVDDRRKGCSQTKHFPTTLDNFWDRCLPNGARRLDSLRMGGRVGGQVPLSAQMVEYLRDGLVHRKLVGALGCLPIADLADVTGKGTGGYSSMFYFDLEGKIGNRTVFDIPWFCSRRQNRGGGKEAWTP